MALAHLPELVRVSDARLMSGAYLPGTTAGSQRLGQLGLATGPAVVQLGADQQHQCQNDHAPFGDSGGHAAAIGLTARAGCRAADVVRARVEVGSAPRIA